MKFWWGSYDLWRKLRKSMVNTQKEHTEFYRITKLEKCRKYTITTRHFRDIPYYRTLEIMKTFSLRQNTINDWLKTPNRKNPQILSHLKIWSNFHNNKKYTKICVQPMNIRVAITTGISGKIWSPIKLWNKLYKYSQKQIFR